MGNGSSKNNINNNIDIPKNVSLEEKMDFIATHYILTMDYESLRKLYEKEYCEKLVILTSDIVDNYFNHLEIHKIAQRIENGSSSSYSPEYNIPEKIVYFPKKDIDNVNISNSEKREFVCNEIAKFYIKIAHIFAAIVTTINPEYVYKDFWGNNIKRKFFEKDKIPHGVHVEVNNLNLCGERINALKGENNDDILNENVEDIKIHPTICNVNLNNKKNLEDEPGIPELIELYYDDKYNFKSGGFEDMSEENSMQYIRDLKRFYTEFTGNVEIPDNIKKFSDIQLKDYNKSVCNKIHEKLNLEEEEEIPEYQGNYKDFLFLQYAKNLRQMVASVNINQKKLLDIIDELFVNVTDPSTDKTYIRINPKLTDELLQNMIVESRNIIVELYLKCEFDFSNGVKIYEAIVESAIENTLEKQISHLENIKHELSTSISYTSH